MVMVMKGNGNEWWWRVMVMKSNGNFERIVREIWENLRENLNSREKLEKWKCDENRLPEKNGKNEIATKKKLAGS